eukprot:Ihof_evm2s42 gene=Ihof_evmTU2s42
MHQIYNLNDKTENNHILGWLPEKRSEQVGRKLRLELVNKTECEGWCYTIDPDTNNVALVCDDEVEGVTINWIRGPSIKTACQIHSDKPCPLNLLDPDCLLEAVMGNKSAPM